MSQSLPLSIEFGLDWVLLLEHPHHTPPLDSLIDTFDLVIDDINITEDLHIERIFPLFIDIARSALASINSLSKQIISFPSQPWELSFFPCTQLLYISLYQTYPTICSRIHHFPITYHQILSALLHAANSLLEACQPYLQSISDDPSYQQLNTIVQNLNSRIQWAHALPTIQRTASQHTSFTISLHASIPLFSPDSDSRLHSSTSITANITFSARDLFSFSPLLPNDTHAILCQGTLGINQCIKAPYPSPCLNLVLPRILYLILLSLNILEHGPNHFSTKQLSRSFCPNPDYPIPPNLLDLIDVSLYNPQSDGSILQWTPPNNLPDSKPLYFLTFDWASSLIQLAMLIVDQMLAHQPNINQNTRLQTIYSDIRAFENRLQQTSPALRSESEHLVSILKKELHQHHPKHSSSPESLPSPNTSSPLSPFASSLRHLFPKYSWHIQDDFIDFDRILVDHDSIWIPTQHHIYTVHISDSPDNVTQRYTIHSTLSHSLLAPSDHDPLLPSPKQRYTLVKTDHSIILLQPGATPFFLSHTPNHRVVSTPVHNAPPLSSLPIIHAEFLPQSKRVWILFSDASYFAFSIDHLPDRPPLTTFIPGHPNLQLHSTPASQSHFQIRSLSNPHQQSHVFLVEQFSFHQELPNQTGSFDKQRFLLSISNNNNNNNNDDDDNTFQIALTLFSPGRSFVPPQLPPSLNQLKCSAFGQPIIINQTLLVPFLQNNQIFILPILLPSLSPDSISSADLSFQEPILLNGITATHPLPRIQFATGLVEHTLSKHQIIVLMVDFTLVAIKLPDYSILWTTSIHQHEPQHPSTSTTPPPVLMDGFVIASINSLSLVDIASGSLLANAAKSSGVDNNCFLSVRSLNHSIQILIGERHPVDLLQSVEIRNFIAEVTPS